MSAIRNGSWLDEQEFPEIAWVIPGILPEGCTVLTGHPKIGKSFLVLNIALAAASGGEVLGVPVEKRPVLYLALEDSPRRIQKRAHQLNDGDPLPPTLHYLTSENQSAAVEEALEWKRANADAKPLIIADTLERIRAKRSGHAYQDDYAAGGLLQSLAAPGGAALAVHHNRKNDSSEDFIDDVSGTLGLTGSMDTVLNLKRKRAANEGTLSVTGRDVDEMIYKVVFSDAGKWEAAGSGLADAARRVSEDRFGARMQDVLAAVEQWKDPVSPIEVSEATGIPVATTRKYLSRLYEHGLIRRIAVGKYQAVLVSEVSRSATQDCAPAREPTAA